MKRDLPPEILAADQVRGSDQGGDAERGGRGRKSATVDPKVPKGAGGRVIASPVIEPPEIVASAAASSPERAAGPVRRKIVIGKASEIPSAMEQLVDSWRK